MADSVLFLGLQRVFMLFNHTGEIIIHGRHRHHAGLKPSIHLLLIRIVAGPILLQEDAFLHPVP